MEIYKTSYENFRCTDNEFESFLNLIITPKFFNSLLKEDDFTNYDLEDFISYCYSCIVNIIEEDLWPLYYQEQEIVSDFLKNYLNNKNPDEHYNIIINLGIEDEKIIRKVLKNKIKEFNIKINNNF